eukprot:CAMPEP_0115425312 /NCGR_PEP_ID=MMETSP0271-20121206/28310_1 /TAXON_ID=71861 /ORGANISM="Scrippsiella trochoidea, Strain CCMP3099" /LENGTH=314 /DNA_ID=CAMNT_0002850197 /DNA_START=40 /DNA_END=984 /DNA_ORIENTATION=-
MTATAAAAAPSIAEAVAAAQAAASHRLQQSQVDVVLEALTTDADRDITCFESVAGLGEIVTSWEPELQGAGVGIDACKALQDPIYVFSQSLWNQPNLPTDVDSSDPIFVSPLGHLGPVIQPPPGLESVAPWHSDKEAAQIELSTRVTMDSKVAAPQRRRRRRCQLVIATHLRDMEQEDASCVVHFRQIHKLGFRSPELLHEYCSRFGPVKRVAESNMHSKPEKAPRPAFPVRVRPSGIGFVIMERPEDAEAIIAEGEIQTIHGCQVRVRRFEAREDRRHEDCEDTSVATTRPPSCADSLADGALSELSAEAYQE